MIITIKGADFSSANIGTLSTYIISKSIGSGASFDIPNFVDKNSSVNWVITLDEGYTFGTYSVTMGGVEVTPTVVDNVMTISIAEVTGNVRIVVATVNENGEEDIPVVPDVPTFNDSITIDVKNFVKATDILPTDTEYHVEGISFSTRYWVGAASQTDASKRGVYYLDTFPFNDSEYLSCCVNVEDAIANGYTKLKVIKTNVSSTQMDNSCYYNRRTSTSTDWSDGKETDRISCPNNTEITLNGYKSIWFGIRKIAKDGTASLYAGDSVTFKFIK